MLIHDEPLSKCCWSKCCFSSEVSQRRWNCKTTGFANQKVQRTFRNGARITRCVHAGIQLSMAGAAHIGHDAPLGNQANTSGCERRRFDELDGQHKLSCSVQMEKTGQESKNRGSMQRSKTTGFANQNVQRRPTGRIATDNVRTLSKSSQRTPNSLAKKQLEERKPG